MNEPHDPNVTTDHNPALADALSHLDPHKTTDDAPSAASTDASHPHTGAAGDFPPIPGYRVLREIARGGMGRVLGARDLTLDRDVALKVLLPGANADRFVRESKITARLPHPGIPPVHALGKLPDGAPFLAMKLIDGQTLAEAMKTADQPRLLQAFAQVCQAVGFAHSRGIIHRDLKPANVMVGAFGEVQVMDWGLAKDLASREDAAERRSAVPPIPAHSAADPNQTGDFHEESTEDETRAGTVLGTPSYMAPEQARGEPTDAHADVFALGGILCRILTGKPPFEGKTSLDTIRQAAAADLAETDARLNACDADAELVALCRHCLSPNPADRPANGQTVADGMTAYLSGVQERLHTVEREQAVATAKATEGRRRRKVLMIAVSLVLLVLAAGVVGTTLGMFEAKRQRVYAEEGWGKAEKESATARNALVNIGKQISQLQSGVTNWKRADLARKQALDEARGALEQVRAERPDDEMLQVQAALLHRYAANISRSLRDYAGAKAAYATSIQISEELTARFPSNAEHSLALALTLDDVASCEMLFGKLKDAAATLDRALTIPEKVQTASLESDRRRTVGSIEYDRARVAYLCGQFEDSLRFAGRARELFDQLKTVRHAERQAIDPLLAAMAVNCLAISRRELGQTTEALAAHADAVARMKALAGPQANPDELYWLCEVRRERARTAMAVTERQAAEAADLVEVSRLAEKLVDEFPELVLYREKLAATYLLRGELLARLGQLEAANAELTKSLAVSRVLIDRFGAQAPSLLVRGQTFLALGRVRAAAGKADEAAAQWKNAAKVFELGQKNDPENFHRRRAQAETEQALKALGK